MSSHHQPDGESRTADTFRNDRTPDTRPGGAGEPQGTQTPEIGEHGTQGHAAYGWKNTEQDSRNHGAMDPRSTRGTSVQSSSHHPYAPPAGRWEYIPGNAEDAQRQMQAAKSTDISLILGILAVTVLPLFGPFALWQALKAEKLGGRATPGKVLGWVGIAYLILFVLWLVFFITVWGFALSQIQQGMNSNV